MSKSNSELFKDDPATYYTQLGAQAERERIIKLLEDEVKYDFPPIIEMSLDTFKALIKRENND